MTLMKATRKRPTYTFTLDPSPMTHIEEFARFNGVSVSHCMRQAVRNYARSVCQKERPKRRAEAKAKRPAPSTRAFRIAG